MPVAVARYLSHTTGFTCGIPAVHPCPGGLLNWLRSRPVWGATLLYCALILVMGRHVVGSLFESVANDEGDPLLNAAILAWNATHVPGTEAWWHFPIFHPTPDSLTFSEHLVGVSVVSAPLHWLTGSALAAYNLTVLLSFPLSALAMYALVWRLTKNAPASLLAGLAFGFAPYRVSHLPHIQVLAVFWAPLALLGLHAYIEERRGRWLLLFGGCWLLQGMANGYFLVYFSVLIGLWVLWFVVLQRRWRELAAIAAAAIAAALPLAPILYRYVTVHAGHGFTRDGDEIAGYGADMAGVLCASNGLTFWAWLQVACRGEGELFAGAGLVGLCAGAAIALRRHDDPSRVTVSSPAARIAGTMLLTVGLVYLLVWLSVVTLGPWRFDIGVLRVSATTAVKPFSTALLFLILAAVSTPGARRAARRASVPGFYLGAGLLCWALSWGPEPLLMGGRALHQGPFLWLMQLPGVNGLRVPARFWMMAIICIAVLTGTLLARLWPRLARRHALALSAVAACALMMDGWTTIRTVAAPSPAPAPHLLRGGIVMELPLGDIRQDIEAEFRAVTGGWRTANGYSGFEPGYYGVLRGASEEEEDAIFIPFLPHGPLGVLVRTDAPRLIDVVKRQPGAVQVGAADGLLQYIIPQQGSAPSGAGAAREQAAPERIEGRPLRIAGLSASCSSEMLPLVLDADRTTRWHCGPQQPGQEITVDLGSIGTVTAVVTGLGLFSGDFPRRLVIDTSVDGVVWEAAREGGVSRELMEGAVRDSNALRIVLQVPARPARYVRLRQLRSHPVIYWSIAHLEVWGTTGGDGTAVSR